MREIVCPHCSKTFNLDDAGYAAILKQVRDSDFDQQLHDRLEVAEREKTNELQIATMKITADKETIIQELKAKIANDEISRQLAVSETKTTLKEQYEAQIRDRDLEIERLRDHKAKLSTKMVGETLEQHCETEFNRIRSTAFPRAYFEKDNDIRTGSKGDYIFRDKDETGNEIISIMIEPSHNANFVALMDQYLPSWPQLRDKLNALPVRHADWDY